MKLASAAGFTAYEPLVFPEDVFALHGDLRKISGKQLTTLLGDHGMKLAALHTGAIFTDPNIYRTCIDYNKKAIEFAG